MAVVIHFMIIVEVASTVIIVIMAITMPTMTMIVMNKMTIRVMMMDKENMKEKSYSFAVFVTGVKGDREH